MKEKSIKTILFLTFFLSTTLLTNAQKGVDNSVFGIQANPFGVEVYHEARINDVSVLRSSVRSRAQFSLGPENKKSYGAYYVYAYHPCIDVTPKWYYNILSRQAKGHHTKRNSADYVAVTLSYYPPFILRQNIKGLYSRIHQLNIVPTWGFRRKLLGHFNYEVKAGIGPGISLSSKPKLSFNYELGVKVGFDF